MATERTVYRFRKGEEFSLDSIYGIQGLGGDWWEKVSDGNDDLDLSELCRCTRDITITVVIESPNAQIERRVCASAPMKGSTT